MAAATWDGQYRTMRPVDLIVCKSNNPFIVPNLQMAITSWKASRWTRYRPMLQVTIPWIFRALNLFRWDTPSTEISTQEYDRYSPTSYETHIIQLAPNFPNCGYEIIFKKLWEDFSKIRARSRTTTHQHRQYNNNKNDPHYLKQT